MGIAIKAAGRTQDLGIVKTTSTSVAVSITTNLTNPTNGTEALHILCQAISFVALSSNTGVVYICDTASPTLGDGVEAGVLWEVPPPNTSPPPITRPSWSVGDPAGPSPVDTGEYYVLPTVSGEGLRVTAII